MGCRLWVQGTATYIEGSHPSDPSTHSDNFRWGSSGGLVGISCQWAYSFHPARARLAIGFDSVAVSVSTCPGGSCCSKPSWKHYTEHNRVVHLMRLAMQRSRNARATLVGIHWLLLSRNVSPVSPEDLEAAEGSCCKKVFGKLHKGGSPSFRRCTQGVNHLWVASILEICTGGSRRTVQYMHHSLSNIFPSFTLRCTCNGNARQVSQCRGSANVGILLRAHGQLGERVSPIIPIIHCYFWCIKAGKMWPRCGPDVARLVWP